MMGLLLVLITCIAYLPAFHAGFIWDDDRYVTNNPLLTAPDGWWRIWFSLDSPSQYFPLTYSIFRLQHALWGLVPAGYHWFNILLHAVNALLVWRLLQRLRLPGAWLAAAIFAIHPVQVESVAWITELKNVLSLFFVLLALLAWFEFISEESRSQWRWYLLALAAQALALAAKTTACTLPAALLLMLWLKHKPVRWSRGAQLIPFLALGAGMGLLAMWWERYHQGTSGGWPALNFPERILVASHAVWFYLGKLLWPVNLTFSYPRWVLHPGAPLAYGWLAAAVALGALVWVFRRRWGRGPEVALLFYGLTLAPLLGFVMLFTFVYSFVADHYQYIACIGPIALAAAGIVRAVDSAGQASRWLKPAVCGALLLTLGGLTWRQCGMYANQEILWQTTLQRNPASWMAHVNLGEFLAQQGRLDEAAAQWREAIQMNSGDAAAFYDLGVACSATGRAREAVDDFGKALKIEPHFAKASSRLAWVLATCPDAALRNGPEAMRWAQAANQLTRGANADVLGTLGAAYACAGKFADAVAATRQALQLAPALDDPVLMDTLREQLNCYQTNSIFCDPGLSPKSASPNTERSPNAEIRNDEPAVPEK
jgi:tetratricopeptide (TPR) repeat protein